MRDRLEDMIYDLGQEYFQQAHAPMYDTLESDSKKAFVFGVQEVIDTIFSSVKSG